MKDSLRDARHLLMPLVLLVVGILGFLVVRAAVVPPGFGKYGHFRAGALEDVRNRTLSFAGQDTCLGCHSDIGDIRKTESNIDAGIKYMRFMINQYYAKEPMTPLNKALFTFASYNAGPGRIAQMRREAKKRGLDPDIWFGNVEYVAAEKIGQETVTYVSNIYKYYIGYRLILESRAAREQTMAKMKTGTD